MIKWLCQSIAVFVILCSASKAQNPYHINFNTFDGLPSTEVYDVELDSNGVAWFCTDRGVCTYNGYEFKPYTTREGLSNNTILQVIKGPDGRLWFLGLDGTLSYTDNGGITPFKGNERISSIVGWDRLLNHIYWGDNGEIYLIHRDPLERSFCQVVTLAGDIRRSATFKEISALSLSGEVHGLPYTKIGKQYVFESRINRILVPKEQDVYYVDLFSRRRLIHGMLSQPDYHQDHVLSGEINNLYADHNDNLWVSTSEGMCVFAGGDLSLPPKMYFQGIACSSTIQDFEGNFWVTTLDHGVFLIPSMNVHQVPHQLISKSSKTIVSLVPGESHLFFGTQSGEIFALDQNFQPKLLFQNHEFWGRFGYASATAQGTYFNRYSLTELGNEIVIDSHKLNLNLPLVLKLSNGDVLNAGYSGFDILRGDPLSEIHSSARPRGVRIFSAAEQGDNLWLGTMRGLIKIRQFDYNSASPFAPNEPLLKCRINDILPDSHGNLWLATIGNGLLYLQGDQLTQVSPKDGLQSNMINKIALDDKGKLWVASNEGVYSISYTVSPQFQLKKIRNFNIEDGLPTNFVRDISVWANQIWLATDQGLTYFSPLDFQQNAFISPVIYIEEVLVNQRKVNPHVQHQFSQNENSITLRYLGISNRKIREKPFYRYRLSGLDTNWTYTNDRNVHYINLPGGEYTFTTMARNKNGKWSSTPARFTFSIARKFTDSWLFYALLVAVGLILVLGTFFFAASRSSS